MPLHKDLTGADLHEPKDVDSATSGQVYIADGVGSGSWQTLSIPSDNFLITYAFFSSSGTWTKPSNLIGVEAVLVGGGAHYNIGTNGGTTSFAGKSAVGGTTGAGGATGATGGTGDQTFKGSVRAASNTDAFAGVAPFHFSPSNKFGWGENAGKCDGSLSVGASGEATISFIAADDLGSTESVTIGAGGSIGGVGGCAFIKQYILDT